MPTITTVGLDLAKKVFQVHGVDAEGRVVVARTPHLFASAFSSKFRILFRAARPQGCDVAVSMSAADCRPWGRSCKGLAMPRLGGDRP